MPIDGTTRFESITIYSPLVAFQLYARPTSGPTYVWLWKRPGLLLDYRSSESDLIALQALYASSDGIRDANGNAVPITWDSDSIDPDDIPKTGWFNPLIPGAFEEWQNAQEVSSIFGDEVVISRDSTTGRPDFASTVGITPANRVPDTGEMTQFLSDWYAEVAGSGQFRLSLQTSGLLSSNILNDTRVEAIARWLAGKRTSGSAVNIDGVTTQSQLHSAFHQRILTIEQSSGSSIVCQLVSTGVGSTSMSINLRYESG